jgi:hypothetical protein
MKNLIKKMLIFSVLLIGLIACQENKKDGSVKGMVEEIQNGKDGYTAIIKTEENERYFATVSHANLNNPKQYKSANLGDKIKVVGDHWEMEGEKHITVRELYFE